MDLAVMSTGLSLLENSKGNRGHHHGNKHRSNLSQRASLKLPIWRQAPNWEFSMLEIELNLVK